METSIINTFPAKGIDSNDIGAMLKQKLSPLLEITKRCERVIHILKEGRKKEASEIFHFEFYLINKYLYIT